MFSRIRQGKINSTSLWCSLNKMLFVIHFKNHTINLVSFCSNMLVFYVWGGRVSSWETFFRGYFSWGFLLWVVLFLGVYFLSGGYNQRKKLMVNLLQYLSLPPSFSVELGLLTVVNRSKLNPLNIEVRRKGGG